MGLSRNELLGLGALGAVGLYVFSGVGANGSGGFGGSSGSGDEPSIESIVPNLIPAALKDAGVVINILPPDPIIETTSFLTGADLTKKSAAVVPSGGTTDYFGHGSMEAARTSLEGLAPSEYPYNIEKIELMPTKKATPHGGTTHYFGHGTITAARESLAGQAPSEYEYNIKKIPLTTPKEPTYFGSKTLTWDSIMKEHDVYGKLIPKKSTLVAPVSLPKIAKAPEIVLPAPSTSVVKKVSTSSLDAYKAARVAAGTAPSIKKVSSSSKKSKVTRSNIKVGQSRTSKTGRKITRKF